MKTIACHVRIGEKPWCQCEVPPGLFREAGERKVDITCRQQSAANAVAFVHLLQDLGVGNAAITEGLCEWDPKNGELKALQKRRQTVST